MKRVPPSERTRAELVALFAGGVATDPQAELVRLAVRQIVEEALEATVIWYVRNRAWWEGIYPK